MSNTRKFEVLLEIAEKLNQDIGSVPVLYGSLGLSRAIEVDLQTDDIDILIEDCIFSERLSYIHGLMEELGFTLTDPEENEFRRGTTKVGIASDGDMLSFSGVDPLSLAVESSAAKFRVLSPEQYLATYKASSLDGYRKKCTQER
ncbi:hypothetical protein [Gynuella sp.]|uniref:hypothetical protein n=1 Tax=Gynuella sp. TaxID=2969146 RepID=UPI003D0DD128